MKNKRNRRSRSGQWPDPESAAEETTISIGEVSDLPHQYCQDENDDIKMCPRCPEWRKRPVHKNGKYCRFHKSLINRDEYKKRKAKKWEADDENRKRRV